MRTYDPNDLYWNKEIKELLAQPWQIELLKMNPKYPFWGPHEDYMSDGTGWDAPQTFSSWKEFKWDLDDLNELVNFYFRLNRSSKNCDVCHRSGYHPDALWISDSFYRHSSPFDYGKYPDETLLKLYGEKFERFCEEMMVHKEWHHRITEDEAKALWDASRVKLHANIEVGYASAEEINAWESQNTLGHDAINRSILVGQRIKRLGLPEVCPDCKGKGYIYTEDLCKVQLVLWILHPRKGCSRGVEIQNIEQDDLPKVFAYLRQAASRNAERFSKIPGEENEAEAHILLLKGKEFSDWYPFGVYKNSKDATKVEKTLKKEGYDTRQFAKKFIESLLENLERILTEKPENWD